MGGEFDERGREEVDQVGGDEGELSSGFGGYVACKPVEVNSEAGGIEGVEALGDECGDDPGEDVSATAGRHTGVSRRVDKGAAAVRDNGGGTLEHDDLTSVSGEGGAAFLAVVGVEVEPGGLDKPAHFSGVGGQDKSSLGGPGPVPEGGEIVESVGIDDDESVGQFGQSGDEGGAAGTGSHSGAYGDNVVVLGESSDLIDGGTGDEPARGLFEGLAGGAGTDGEDRLDGAAWAGDLDQACAGTKGGQAGECGGAGHGGATADD